MLKYILLLLSTVIVHKLPVDHSMENSSYTVKKITQPIVIDANWDKSPWTSIAALTLENFMGEKPDHFPKVNAKVAYDDDAIYVIFRVDDRFVRAIRTKHQESVFKDSCVEFFFTPEGSTERGYFNLEMNCGGTMLFHHQLARGKDSKHISPQDISKVTVAHSLPQKVEPEIKEPTTWTVEYRIPFEMLERYLEMGAPKSGTIRRGNFYKCADETSHPHWLTWAPIDRPKPDFHLPEFFGTLVFE